MWLLPPAYDYHTTDQHRSSLPCAFQEEVRCYITRIVPWERMRGGGWVGVSCMIQFFQCIHAQSWRGPQSGLMCSRHTTPAVISRNVLHTSLLLHASLQEMMRKIMVIEAHPPLPSLPTSFCHLLFLQWSLCESQFRINRVLITTVRATDCRDIECPCPRMACFMALLCSVRVVAAKPAGIYPDEPRRQLLIIDYFLQYQFLYSMRLSI